MNVHHSPNPQTPARRVPGPADMQGLDHGVVVLTGTPNRDRDFGHWAGALGAAALRGVQITWQR